MGSQVRIPLPPEVRCRKHGNFWDNHQLNIVCRDTPPSGGVSFFGAVCDVPSCFPSVGRSDAGRESERRISEEAGLRIRLRRLPPSIRGPFENTLPGICLRVAYFGGREDGLRRDIRRIRPRRFDVVPAPLSGRTPVAPLRTGDGPQRHKKAGSIKGFRRMRSGNAVRKGGYSSMKSMLTWRWNTSCNEMLVSVAEIPGMRRTPSKIVRIRCSLSTQ